MQFAEKCAPYLRYSTCLFTKRETKQTNKQYLLNVYNLKISKNTALQFRLYPLHMKTLLKIYNNGYWIQLSKRKLWHNSWNLRSMHDIHPTSNDWLHSTTLGSIKLPDEATLYPTLRFEFKQRLSKVVHPFYKALHLN